MSGHDNQASVADDEIERKFKALDAKEKDAEIVALERELEAEQASLAATEAQRERDNKAALLKQQIAETKRKRREEEALAEAVAKYGPIGDKIQPIETIDTMIIVKRHDGVKVQKWLDKHGENPKVQPCRELGRPCVVYPPIDEFDAMVEDRPAIIVLVANAVLKLAGMGGKELGGK